MAQMTDTSIFSPDATVLWAGSGGSLATGYVVWTFSTGKTTTGNYILLNGKTIGSAAATWLKVANSGTLYSINAQGQWFRWTGTTWSAIANPDPLTMALVSDTGNLAPDGITS